ncbi:dihydrodipicolinate synthase family protein [Halalkalibaculum sp. DA3122]|uniref:dihydrodipicolinate synthase family protein n=1 Tax=Halalkalibaculum sp. DA3122 TaxID=3373607 RepID=UPI003754E558
MYSIEGIVPPMITPLLNEDALDHKGIEKLVDHLISGGVNGLFLLGTTGESPSLTQSLRFELLETACNRVNGRIPVLVGLMDTSYKESVDVAEKAKELGVKAVVLAPPSFYKINQEELYNLVVNMLDDISLPMYLYNNPGVTQASFDLETVGKLLTREEILGIKDSSGDMKYYQQLMEYTQDSNTALYMGPEELLMESLLLGGNGGIPGGANIFPELYVNMYKSASSGDLKRALVLQREIMKISKVVYSGAGYGAGNVINGIKCALKSLDICNDYVAKPLSQVDAEKAEKIENLVGTILTTVEDLETEVEK